MRPSTRMLLLMALYEVQGTAKYSDLLNNGNIPTITHRAWGWNYVIITKWIYGIIRDRMNFDVYVIEYSNSWYFNFYSPAIARYDNEGVIAWNQR